MKTLHRVWKKREGNAGLGKEISDVLNVNPIVAQILTQRGLHTIEEAKEFLELDPSSLHDPFSLPDLGKALERIERAFKHNEKILIYGDYDVDGVTSTSLYLEGFKKMGVSVETYIPNRLEEGYGLNCAAIQKISEKGVGLMITADCGTTSHEPLSLAQKLGMDVIVTDHHQIPAVLPPTFALINPHRKDSKYPFLGLCAVGIAFKVVQALLQRMTGEKEVLDPSLIPLLDLVALGTIADVAPLIDENRFLVKEGLQLLTRGSRRGVRALKEVCQLADKKIGVGAVGFVLAPRINAGGRIGSANEGVVLLTTSSDQEAKKAAVFLNHQNQERKRIEAEMIKEAEEMVISGVDLDREKALVLASKNWHPGVIGILASRLVEKYYRPTVIIALTPDGKGKGSARSIPAFNLYDGLEKCSSLFEAFGGHQYAAGITILEENIEVFRKQLSSIVENSLGPDDFKPRLWIDAEVQLDDLDFQFHQELEKISPFGISNPEPVLVARGLEPLFPKVVGKHHLKLTLRRGTIRHEAIGFQMADRFSAVSTKGCKVDVAFSLVHDTWNGQERLQLRIKDMRPEESSLSSTTETQTNYLPIGGVAQI